MAVLGTACTVSFNRLDNTPIALLMLLLVNWMFLFCFDFITIVNSSSTFVVQMPVAFAGNSHFDGMNRYVSVY